MNPMETTRHILTRLKEQVRFALPIERSAPEFTQPLDDLMDDYALLARGPYLEMTPPYRAGSSLEQLTTGGVLHADTSSVFADALGGCSPEKFKLYEHQDQAVRSVISDNKNLIVSSGTGSGKTECFLLPLIDSLIREKENGTLGNPGVRAMILYPMNALVNDQIRRLRTLLKEIPEIRFGKYTGELASTRDEEDPIEFPQSLCNDFEAALEGGDRRWSGIGDDDEMPLSNEVTRRTEWRTNPGHILVTNYSMLEYLLLRPDDSSLFQLHPWQFIVVDEAHCYSGAMGTEIAWLLRRVVRRLQEYHPNSEPPRYIATSATLISDATLDDLEKTDLITSEFASQLFPAEPNSFHVELGRSVPYAELEVENTWDWDVPGCGVPDSVARIRDASCNGSSVYDRTLHMLGRLSWIERLEDCVSVLDACTPGGGVGGPMPIGDVVHVLSMARASAAVLDLANSDALEGAGLLDSCEENTATLRVLWRVCREGIGPHNDNDAWRYYLHDEMDSAWSTENPPRRVGNRLHLLPTFMNDANHDNSMAMSLEGLDYLLSTSCSVVQRSDAQIELRDLPIVCSDHLLAVLEDFKAAVTAYKAELESSRNELVQLWKNVVADETGQQPQQDTIEGILFWFLAQSPAVIALAERLREASETPEQAELSKLDQVGAAVFPGAPEDVLIGLLDLCNLAKRPHSRNSLLEVRYHQLIRGLQQVGLSFAVNGNGSLSMDGNGHPTIQLHEGDEDANDEGHPVFGLGLCRNCGQPFVLGYLTHIAPTSVPANDSRVLARMPSETHRFLQAFAWRQGSVPASLADDSLIQPPDQDRWYLDVTNGELHDSPLPNCLESVWLRSPNEQQYPSFIRQCPCCGESHRRPSLTQFGPVTPFEYTSQQARFVCLEELARRMDVSADPLASSRPGDGRKVLTFSDSRSGAARLAWGFEKYMWDVTSDRLLVDAAGSQVSVSLDQLIEVLNQVRGDPAAALAQFTTVQGSLDEALGVCGAESNGAAALQLSQTVINRVAQGEDPEVVLGEELNQFISAPQGLATLGPRINQRVKNENLGDLFLWDDEGQVIVSDVVSQYESLKVVARKGRYSLFTRGLLVLRSAGLYEQYENNTQDWQDFLNAVGGNPDDALRVAHAVYQTLLERRCTTCPQNGNDGGSWAREDYWPWGPTRSIRRNGQTQVPQNLFTAALTFTSAQANALLNTVVRQALNLSDNQAQAAADILEALWLLLVNSHVFVSYAGHQGLYQIDWQDMRLVVGHVPTADGEEEPEPYDREPRNLATRTLVPLRIEEHTAQLAKGRGRAYQKAFLDGLVNILSCSTTFEMGVDVGDLSAVFLGNLPPSVANYRQRAGRAGRRAGVSAYVLTFAGYDTHDRYYWSQPGALFFGDMDLPRFYLENEMIRARHLRAEAFHDFVAWLIGGGHHRAQSTSHDGTPGPILARRWSALSDLIFGFRIVKPHGQSNHRRVCTFPPITEDFPNWRAQRQQSVNQYVQSIADVNNLGYDVANDLVFQLAPDAHLQLKPYALDQQNLDAIRLLGGPNGVPETGTTPVADRSVQHRVYQLFDNCVQNGVTARLPGTASCQGFQVYLVKKGQTLQWLARLRVLPKYGFPVDIAQLLPHPHDHYGSDVDLSRDLRIGIFEYAPEQEVVANKRVFRAITARKWGNQQNVLRQFTRCQNCGFIVWDQQTIAPCTACGANSVFLMHALQPDVFGADRSHAQRSVPAQRGVPQHMYVGSVLPGSYQAVAGTRLRTAESDSGRIVYMNRGPRGRGYDLCGQNSVVLYHDVHTEVAIWLADDNLFQPGGAFAALRNHQLPGNANRLYPAMQSALSALLVAASEELGIRASEIGGVLWPCGDLSTGFVLYDDVSGGAGHVMPLVLNQQAGPQQRIDLIASILERAVELCTDCHCGGNAHVNNALIPVPREQYMSFDPQQRQSYRIRASCPRCLRLGSNRMYHHLLDRHDAKSVLDQLVL